MTFRLQFWPTVITVVGVVVLMWLGIWQVQRLHWKRDLAATVAARTNLAPRPIPAAAVWPKLDMAPLIYAPASATGRYLHRKERYVFTSLGRPKGRFGGPGYWVVTPLELADGSGYVLVNRGFVPIHKLAPESRGPGQAAGVVTVRGLMRQSRHPGLFTPRDNPRDNRWYTMNIDALGADLALAPMAPFVIDATGPPPPGGLPQTGETRLRFINNHLGYAVTWFALALCLIAIYTVSSMSRRDQGPIS